MVRRKAPPEKYEGPLVAERKSVLGLRVDARGWAVGEELLLFEGGTGRRKVTDGRFVASRDGVAVVKIAPHWRLIDTRDRTRYATAIEIAMHTGPRSRPQPAVMTDISNGGMAVQVATPVAEETVEITIEHEGFSSRLSCRVVNAESDDEQTVLHLQFEGLSSAQAAFVRNLLAWAAEMAEVVRLAA